MVLKYEGAFAFSWGLCNQMPQWLPQWLHSSMETVLHWAPTWENWDHWTSPCVGYDYTSHPLSLYNSSTPLRDQGMAGPPACV